MIRIDSGDRTRIRVNHQTLSGMITITQNIAIAENDLSWEFIRSSGPGGQNVNKVATAVQLRFDVARAQGLPSYVRSRIMDTAGRRVTADGVLIINARRFRSQERNRADALDRLKEIIIAATHTPRKRIETKPTAASRIRKARSKLHRSRVKGLRRQAPSHQE